MLGSLPVINEDQEESGEVSYNLRDKPSYFDMLDDDNVDSEDELVSGENNYIEIKCLPLIPEKKPEPEKKEDEPVASAEEEKKGSEEDRSSQFAPSPRNNNSNSAFGSKNDSIIDSNAAQESMVDSVADNPVEEEKKAEAAPAVVDDDGDEIFCRFCWDGMNTIENPLLSVCKCSGGVGFVHYTCLKYWLKTKQTENKTFTSITIYWRTFGCEICQQIYPYIFKANGRKYSLIEI